MVISMVIWKWEIEVADKQTFMMPAGAKLLDVHNAGRGMLHLGIVRSECGERSATPSDIRNWQSYSG